MGVLPITGFLADGEEVEMLHIDTARLQAQPQPITTVAPPE